MRWKNEKYFLQIALQFNVARSRAAYRKDTQVRQGCFWCAVQEGTFFQS